MLFGLVAEGQCDIEVGRRLLIARGHELDMEFNCRGKGNLDKRLPGFTTAARNAGSHWLVIRDLDADADCPPTLVANLIPGACPASLRFRIASKAIESWLMADRDALADWLQISATNLPRAPEQVDHPKRFLADVSRRSRSRDLRERMAADSRSGAVVGPDYEGAISEFIRGIWNPDRASESGLAISLTRALAALER